MQHHAYLCICPTAFGGSFGKGDTIRAAKDEAKAQGGNLNQHVVYAMPEGSADAYVDPMSGIKWTWLPGYETTESTDLPIVSKRGVQV